MCLTSPIEYDDLLILSSLLQDAVCSSKGNSNGDKRDADPDQDEDERIGLFLDHLGLACFDRLHFSDDLGSLGARVNIVLVEHLLNDLLDGLHLLLAQLIVKIALAEVFFGVFAHELVGLQRNCGLDRSLVVLESTLDLLVGISDGHSIDRGSHASWLVPTFRADWFITDCLGVCTR